MQALMPCFQILKQYFALYNRICNQAGYINGTKLTITVRGNSVPSRKLETLSRDYSAHLRDNYTLSRVYAALSRE